jgi:hypothetical protein
MMSLTDTIPGRYGRISMLSEENPEFVVGLRGLKPRVFFVNSNNTNSSRDGKSWDGALTTMVAAAALTVAGDVVCVAEGHVETVIAADGLTLSVAGVTWIGFGSGNRRPQVNFTTVVGASLKISAASVTMKNFRFTGGIDALTGAILIQAADVALFNIVTEDVTGQATDFIVTTDAADRFIISGWQHRGAAAAGADTAISVVGGDDWVIEDFELYGNFAVAAIENVTTAANRVRIGGGGRKCYIWTEHANDIAITMVAASTGFIGPDINIMLQDNAANITECVVGAACQFMLPINVCNLAGEASMVINITASTDA